MQAKAVLRRARVSPQKARLVADMVRGLDVPYAMEVLDHTPKKSAGIIKKVLLGAVANAEHQARTQSLDVDVDMLYIHTIKVDGGPSLRRFRPRAMGRATRIIKRTSHIEIVLDEDI